MELLSGFGYNLVWFLVVLTVLVFVHELGHYWVARRNGIRVEVFSIGFGPEIFGFTDKADTRWKFSAIPLGGYVKMFGEASVEGHAPHVMTPEEEAVSFNHKSLGARAAVVFAGPAANFLFAIVVLAGLFMIIGKPEAPSFQEAGIGGVLEQSAAAEAGMLPGDRIRSIEGMPISSFNDLREAVANSGGRALQFEIERGGENLILTVAPRLETRTTEEGETSRYLLGVQAPGMQYERLGPISAVWTAVTETGRLTVATLSAVGEIIVGDRGTDELGGPIRIAKMSGDFAEGGTIALISFMALLSINLGLINLFPIPMLDGGHLLFYAIEAVTGKPLNERAQEYGLRIGLALILSLMVFVTVNDFIQPGTVEGRSLFEFFRDLFT